MIQKFKDLSFSFFLGSQLFIFICLFISFFVKDHSLMFIIYIFIFIFCCVSYYCLYYICKQITIHAQLEAQNVLAIQQQEFQRNHLLVSKENIEIFEKVRDDIYEKINSFKNININNEEEARLFAKKLIEEYTSLYQIDYCPNKVIDAILYNKLMLAKTYQIKTSVQVIVPETINIKPIDIMSVYTNLLDNAIEACQSVEEKERFINVDCMIQSQYLIIKIENSKSDKNNINSDHPETTKKDKEKHGFGTQIIKKTCENYDGIFKLIDDGNTAEAYATLKIDL